MQPVTIKNNQYSNTLWLTQAGLFLLAVTLMWLGVSIHFGLWLVLPLILLALYSNQHTIKQQSKLQFAMRTNGQLVVSEHFFTQSETDNKVSLNHDDMIVTINAYWQLPQILLLKLTVKHLKTPVYLTLFSSVVGAKDFSHLLVGLTQLNTTLKGNHE